MEEQFNLGIKKSIINDKSEELINLYRCIKYNDKEFFNNLKTIYKNWTLIEKVVENNSIQLLKIYRDYCTDLNINSESKNIKTKFNDKIYAKKDQVRLCEYLKSSKANIMLIIKNTEFIYNLYNTKEFKIKTFDKKYLVSFQNRNDKDVEHLLITNY